MKLWPVIFSPINLWFLLCISLSNRGLGGKLPLPSFVVSWVDDKRTYQAGDIAIVKIKPLEHSSSNESFNPDKYAIKFSLSVNGKKGNSSLISGVLAYTEGDPDNWCISFTPIQVGEFNVVVTEDHSGRSDPTLHFSATPGNIHPSTSMASWMNLVDEFIAGTKSYVLILPKDAFGNNISRAADSPSNDYFMVSASFQNGSHSILQDVRYNGWDKLGYIGIEFIPITAGRLLLYVYGGNRTLRGSPLPLVVTPGSFSVANSRGVWKYGTNSFQVFSKLEMFLYQQDQFGNLVSGSFPFDARVIEKATNLSIPIADFSFQVVAQGVQLLSFIVSEPGDFMLTIFSAQLNNSIAHVPYHYNVFVGYCDGLNSIVNGSCLAVSFAGRMSFFKVYLQDFFHNPSPVEAERLRIIISRKNDSLRVHSITFPLRSSSERSPITGNVYLNGEASWAGRGLPSVNEKDTFTWNPTAQASAFNVAYTAEKSGNYDIWVLCGNIPLNGGRPYLMNVSPGLVDTALSSVVKIFPRAKRLVKNEVVVRLMDSFSNPTPSHKARLSFRIGSTNSAGFLTWAFVDNGDGTYTGNYLAKDLGAYNVSVLFNDKDLSPSPIEVNIYEREYFPEARGDDIIVWEDESVAFDVVLNDYVLAGQAIITESSTPLHGSLLQYGQLFRYTPYKGFYGNDSFSYLLSDMNKNAATGIVTISVLCKPPHFVSLPARLHVIEDVISPKFGGFTGFEVEYSDREENISLAVRAQYGTVFLAPMPFPLWQPGRRRLSASRGGRSGTDLILTGHVESINFALQWIQYLGNENFYGNDIIKLYTMNQNGIEEAHVPVLVEPINDPPVVFAPEFIIIKRTEVNGGFQIFDKKRRDAFNFSVADADLSSFPGNKSHFVVAFSMEVSDGVLSTSLPIYLLNTAERKLKNNNQWEPLQTFVSIANRFVLKGKGIRFQGGIEDCNNAMQKMFHQGAHGDIVLTISINDMGNYGCCSDCRESVSMPLSTEVTVNLIRRRPMSSTAALLLGMVIVSEIVMVILLGGVLLFYFCRCINVLHKERCSSNNNAELPKAENFKDQFNENENQFIGRSRGISFASQESSFRQRMVGESSKMEVSLTKQSSAGDDGDLVPLSTGKHFNV